MRNNFLLVSAVILIIFILGVYLIAGKGSSPGVASPQNTLSKAKTITPSPLPSFTPTPPVFHFDKSTSLKEELDKVNPRVESSDFTELKKLIDSL